MKQIHTKKVAMSTFDVHIIWTLELLYSLNAALELFYSVATIQFNKFLFSFSGFIKSIIVSFYKIFSRSILALTLIKVLCCPIYIYMLDFLLRFRNKSSNFLRVLCIDNQANIFVYCNNTRNKDWSTCDMSR